MTAIVDYGAGNLTSVRYAFAACGVEAAVTRDPEVIRAAAEAKPFLGICLGMQILFSHSEEDGGVETLGVLPGRVRRFPAAVGFKVPEMGWNQVRFVGLEGREAEYYFVHSYYAEIGPYTAGKTDYAGVEFTAFARKGRLWACQFHPEKSGRVGLDLIKEWLSC